jgi:hypothetical protein
MIMGKGALTLQKGNTSLFNFSFEKCMCSSFSVVLAVIIWMLNPYHLFVIVIRRVAMWPSMPAGKQQQTPAQFESAEHAWALLLTLEQGSSSCCDLCWHGQLFKVVVYIAFDVLRVVPGVVAAAGTGNIPEVPTNWGIHEDVYCAVRGGGGLERSETEKARFFASEF